MSPRASPHNHHPALIDPNLVPMLTLFQDPRQPSFLHPAQNILHILHWPLKYIHARTKPMFDRENDPASLYAISDLVSIVYARMAEHESTAVNPGAESDSLNLG
ncbi:hypothetical protein CUC08_Gglean007719 [Alternaria sp. MG1]|nr:hypothetical protein CUC08_Gglean007719 [Alternaria sp. MG1]